MFGNIFKFAWRNTWRNRRRTILTLVAIAVGVMSLVFAGSYIGGIINSAGEATIKTQVGHVRVVHKEFLRLERIMPKEHLVTGLTGLKKDISAIPGVETVNERIRFNVLLNREDVNEAGIAFGIDPGKTDKIAELSKSIVAGRYFSDSDRGLNLVIGKKLAARLKAAVNDELLLVTTDINYSTYALPFKIVGIFETGYSYLDKHMLYIPLQKAQKMLDCRDAAHEILVFIKEPAAARAVCEKVEKILSKNDPNHSIRVIPWQENGMMKSLPALSSIFKKVMGIIMLIVALVILNTMLMAVMERYHEIGVIKALGFKNREVFAMILVEAFYIGTIGSVIGGFFGGTLSAVLEKTGIDMQKLTAGMMEKIDIQVPFLMGKYLYPDFTFSGLFGAMSFGLIVALIAVIYPAVKSSRMLPVEAFRSELKI